MMTFGATGTGLPFVLFDGEPRILARLEPDPSKCRAPRFAEPLVPESNWRDFSLFERWATGIYDQNGQGSCVGHGGTMAFNICWELAGNTPQRFSPCYLYSLINGGRDQGAIVEDAMDALKRKGVCLEATVGPKQIYPSQFDKAEADAEAASYKLVEAYKLDSFSEIVSAVLLGFPVAFGVEIGRNFEPNAEGVVPPLSGQGGGHCMAAVGVKKFSDRWRLQVANSWNARFGAAGLCYMDSSYFSGYVDAFACQVTAADSNQPPA